MDLDNAVLSHDTKDPKEREELSKKVGEVNDRSRNGSGK